jgi:F-type H+-transporting ATPase subunit delta
MDISAIRVRYAKALFSLAKEKNELETLKIDVEKVAKVCDHSPDFINLLESPVIPTTKKSGLIAQIFKTEVSPLTLKFLLLILHNNREEYIPGICRNFLGLIRKDQNIKSATLVTATEIEQKTFNKIKTLIEKELKATVELNSQIDPEIIGGLILRIDDKQYDASITTQLRKIKQEFLETELRK